MFGGSFKMSPDLQEQLNKAHAAIKEAQAAAPAAPAPGEKLSAPEEPEEKPTKKKK